MEIWTINIDLLVVKGRNISFLNPTILCGWIFGERRGFSIFAKF